MFGDPVKDEDEASGELIGGEQQQHSPTGHEYGEDNDAMGTFDQLDTMPASVPSSTLPSQAEFADVGANPFFSDAIDQEAADEAHEEEEEEQEQSLLLRRGHRTTLVLAATADSPARGNLAQAAVTVGVRWAGHCWSCCRG